MKEGLLEGNLDKYEEILYEPLMASLIHYGNTNKRITVKGETNGCHFNFSDDLFNLITCLDHDEEDQVDRTDLNKVIPKKKEVKEEITE